MTSTNKNKNNNNNINNNNNNEKCLTISQERSLLPIYEYKEQILNSLKNYSTLIISGPTGSGKSTQIPQYLFENGWVNEFNTIAVTQPKRGPTIGLAERVSIEIGNGKQDMVGKSVGYGIRFEEKVSSETRIKYMTDGLLIREMILDPLLSKYSAVMIDEAHERSLPTDILMGLLKKIQMKRSDLKLIISIDNDNLNFSQDLFRYFNNQNAASSSTDSLKDSCYILSIQGKSSPTVNTKQPEIQRSNLLSVTLQLKALGVDNLLNFDFLSPPSSTTLRNAVEMLTGLGALDNDGKLTHDGTIMAGIPTEPTFSKMILQSQQYSCSEEAITITAMLSTPDLFIDDNHESYRKDLIVKEGDHLTLLNIFNTFISNDPSSLEWSNQHQINYLAMQRVLQNREQLLSFASKYSIKLSSSLNDQNSDFSIRKAIVSGFFSNIAQLQSDGSYQTLKEKQTLWLHPSSILCLSNSPQLVVYNDKITTTKEYMKIVSSIEPSWINETVPDFYKN